MKPPLFARAVLAVDRAFAAVRDAEKALRDELLLSLTTNEERSALTVAIYDDRAVYLPGGKRHGGLFDWEVKLIANRRFPKTGKILLGAAGGGRELHALTRIGYEVHGFEPAPQLLAGAMRSIQAPGRGKVLAGDYRALIDAQHGGPLGELAAERYDAAILGWGSYSHVLDRDTRIALLRAVKILCPTGPVIVSFIPKHFGGGEVTPWLLAVRKVMPLIARGDPRSDLIFDPTAGFFVIFSRKALAAEAGEAGYELAVHGESPDGHAMLVPAST
jgi:hypothetical protein